MSGRRVRRRRCATGAGAVTVRVTEVGADDPAAFAQVKYRYRCPPPSMSTSGVAPGEVCLNRTAGASDRKSSIA